MTEAFTVGLDTSALSPDFKEHALRGIGRYVYELKRYFDAHPGEGVQVKPFRHEDFAPKGILERCINLLPAGRQTVRQQLLFPILMSAKTKKVFDTVHFPAHMDAPSWSLREYIITVLDLIPLILADMYKADRPSWRFHLARWLEMRAIKNARHIIAISQCTADDVHRVLGIPRERISVTYLGVDDSFFNPDISGLAPVLQKFSIPHHAKYILYVGGIDQRKNCPGLLDVFARMVETHKDKNAPLPLLVLAGRIKQDRQYPKLRARMHDLKISDLVIETDFVSDDDLRLLYKGAAIFFFPSLYEGFGLPVLEAMAAGCPVVCSNRSSLPEITGDAALLVNPQDINQCAQAIGSILDTPSLGDALREKGPIQARKFPWSKTGEATMQVYKELYVQPR